MSSGCTPLVCFTYEIVRDMNSIPTLTKNLLIVNVLLFLGSVVAERYGLSLDTYLGLHFLLSDHFNAAQLFTYQFMHGGFEHLFFNMFALFMFGRVLEQVWGPRRFLFYYVACGIGAGLVQEVVSGLHYYLLQSGMDDQMVAVVMAQGSDALSQHMNFTNPEMANLNLVLNSTTVGASGAIYGILLAFGMLFPNSEMFVFPIPVPVRAKYFVIGYAVLELVLGLSNNVGDHVAHFAHLGGMLFGWLILVYWKKKANHDGYSSF